MHKEHVISPRVFYFICFVLVVVKVSAFSFDRGKENVTLLVVTERPVDQQSPLDSPFLDASAENVGLFSNLRPLCVEPTPFILRPKKENAVDFIRAEGVEI